MVAHSHSLDEIKERRERVFLVLAGIFLAAMTLLNVIGISRFVHIGPLALAVGVLPYPLTFLCTDLISELYGRKRANFVVWVGLGINFFVILTMMLANALPSVAAEYQAPWQTLWLAQPVPLPDGTSLSHQVEFYSLIYACTRGAIVASMLAYMAAQFCDVWLYHFWKKLTRGKHLWLRNNGSTLVSQLVDSAAVMTITFGAAVLRGDQTLSVFLTLIGSNYLFKMVAALLDTLPMYFLTARLSKYLAIDPNREHDL